MGRAIITISESGKVNIPSGNVWMSEMELVELFGGDSPDTPSRCQSDIQEWNTIHCNNSTMRFCNAPKLGYIL